MSNRKAQTLIKELAMQAKQRLKNMSYGAKSENLQTTSFSKNNNLKLISNMGGRKSDAVIKIINDTENEENFNRKVYTLLTNNLDTTSPLKQLIDEASFENFSEQQQERYILELSEKYIKVREEYLSHYGY